VRVTPKMELAFLTTTAKGEQPYWNHIGRSEGASTHTITVVPKLRSDAAAQCDSRLMEVSTPSSPKYGQYLSMTEANRLFRSRGNIQKVKDWLKQNELEYTMEGDFFRVKSSVEKIEKCLSAEFHDFTSTDGRKILRAAEYTLPSHVESSIDFISGIVNFPTKGKRDFKTTTLKKRQDGTVTPATLNSVYNIKDNNVASQKSTQSLFEALGQQFSSGDLADFQEEYNVSVNPVANIIGSNNGWYCLLNPNNCGEANLDVQYIMAVAQNSPTTFWVIDENSNDPFLDWVVALAKDSNPPLVHSISYGSIVSEEPRDDLLRYNTEICKLGLRGVTVMVASGDDGVANFEARNDASQCGFNPSFPATSPYVTSVGATQGPESGSAEIACSSATGGIITTGGGFSINFKRPAWQETVVSNYLKNGPNVPPLNLFNSTGRGYPDVALLGLNYEVYIDRFATPVSGTSASTPAFAGMITLVNGKRLSAGKPPVGFLNPALYKLATAEKVFNDVTSGENNCCAQGGPCCQYGFTASLGWDPLTGLGSVDFEALSAALLKM